MGKSRAGAADAGSSMLTELLLNRLSRALADGPAQLIALALLQLDHPPAEDRPADAHSGVADRRGAPAADLAPTGAAGDVRNLLLAALREVRSLSAALPLPPLDSLSVAQTVERAIHDHERLTGTLVAWRLGVLPIGATPAVKSALYRVIQEALRNAYHHAGGVGQRVSVEQLENVLSLEIGDDGPGFVVARAVQDAEHFGLLGMRERVERLGGVFRVEAGPTPGTTVVALLPLLPPALPEEGQESDGPEREPARAARPTAERSGGA